MNTSSRREFLAGAAAGILASALPPPRRLAGGAKAEVSPEDALARRREYLEMLKKLLPPTNSEYRGRINVHDKTWEDWLERTRELPPDFASMPSIPHLPDPLVLLDGRQTPITRVDQWRTQRELIKAECEKWFTGKMPPPPDNLRGVVTAARKDCDATVREVRLEFGPNRRASLSLELIMPPGGGPFPVFLTNHPRRYPWVNTAIRRGYIGCIYYAHNWLGGATDESDAWLDVYPEYDFSCLARWAWAAMRAVDYLTTLSEVDQDRIAIAGHAENSKQALIAAAFDERIGAVTPSRGNAGDQLPWRYNTDMFVGEPLEEATLIPHWHHPRLRFFAGREHKLPIDQNLLLALVAPRGLLMSHAYMDPSGNVLAFEQSYRSVRTVYELLGKQDKLGLYQQPGENPSSVEDVERYIDFFDTVFGRNRYPTPRMFVHGYCFEKWRELSREHIDPLSYPERAPGDFLLGRGGAPVNSQGEWNRRRTSILERIQWALGEEPPGIPLPSLQESRGRGPQTNGWRGQMVTRPAHVGAGMRGRVLPYGDDLVGDLYYPADPKAGGTRQAGKWPLAIWLHPYGYATGYARYGHWARLVERGFAVMAFDHIGFGVRNEQTLRFYHRYPKWSLLGRMVTDTQAAIDSALHESVIDPSRVYLVGYALGAKVALFTAALDDRVKAVSVSCGFAPVRLSDPNKGTEGLRHYSHLHGLTPRFGFFLGEETRLPVDYDEILAAIAPRPVQVVAPTLDRYNPVQDVRRAIDEARKVYALLGRETKLELETPLDFCRFANVWPAQCDWLAKMVSLEPPAAKA